MRKIAPFLFLVAAWSSQTNVLNAALPPLTNVCYVGDSFVTNENITYALRTMLQQKFGNAGVGLVTMDDVDATPYYVTNTRVGDWIDYQTNATGLNAAYTQNYSSSGTITLAGSAFTGTQFVIHFLGQPYGATFSYAVDGGPPTNVDTSATSGYQTVTAGGYINGTHTLVISVVPPGGGTGVLIYGVSAESPKGVRVHRIGHSGLTAADFAAMDQNIWQAGLRALGCGITIIQFGTNEKWTSQPPSTMTASLATLIASAKAANPSGSVILIAPWDNTIVAPYTMGQYEAVIQAAAVGNGFMNVYQAMGPPALNIARNFYSDSNPYVHPDAAAGQIWAYLIVKYFSLGTLP